MTFHLIDDTPSAVPVTLLAGEDALRQWLEQQPDRVGNWAKATGFSAAPGAVCLLPEDDGRIGRVLAGLDDEAPDPWSFAAIRAALPEGDYRLEGLSGTARAEQAALGWALAGYRYEAFAAPGGPGNGGGARLVWPETCDRERVLRAARATYMVRDLVNTPASHLGPGELADAARELAREHGADFGVTVGEDLLAKNFPAIHAVGRASAHAPRLIDLHWGAQSDPKLTLVGKGVCFDSGGLGLKPASAMKLMKKDMGGAAHVLGLASMIMAAKLPVRLRVLVPAVENSVAGNAFRPLDVITMRGGKTVEIGHTDAEGRLILADALTAACEDGPDLLIDMATLTGAARVALGPDLPALMTDDDALAEALLGHGDSENDPLWRLPLWKPYGKMIEGKVADLSNAAEGGFAGAVTAGLFLQAFVDAGIPWAHLDLMAWNTSSRPGRPEGGEALTLRALFALLENRYGTG